MTDIYKKALDKLGRDSQLGQAQEECAELIQAISKYNRPGIDNEHYAIEKIIEEAVDTKIMIEQIGVMFPYPEIWSKYKKLKLERLSKLLED